MFKFNVEQAVTLVALIVTIIILVIIAAVTIAFAFQSDFINIIAQGSENYSIAQINESKLLDDTAIRIEETTNHISSITANMSDSDDTSYAQQEIQAMIGKYVNYQPEVGTYWEDKDKDGNIKNITDFADTTNFYSYEEQSFSTQTGNDALKWRIWNIKDGKLFLISDKPTSQTLALYGALGYNNGVTLIDNICNTCYSANYDGIKVRNLKIEDIINIAPTANPLNDYYGKIRYSYTMKTPLIWSKYEQGTLNEEGKPTSNEYALNNRSIPYPLTLQSTTESIPVTPYITHFGPTKTSIIVSSNNEVFNELIAGSQNYWLSSRCFATAADPNNCYFSLSYIYAYGIDYSNLYGLKGNHESSDLQNKKLRPLVSIPLTSCVLTPSTTNDNEIDYKITNK